MMPADDTTAAERAAEERWPDEDAGGGPVDVNGLLRDGFVAGAAWMAERTRVLTREQIIDALEWHITSRQVRVLITDALLAQGDVPAQTPEPTKPRMGVKEAIDAARAADREAAIRADQRERDAQIAEKEGHAWSGSPAHAMFKVAAAIREGNNHA
jgi:hypothetical protein